jgi:hypothetical protein
MNYKTPAVKVVVESRERPVRILEYASNEMIGTRYEHETLRRSVLTSQVLDEKQTKTIHDAQLLADDLGVELKIEDLSGYSFARRLYAKLVEKKRAPSIELPYYWSGVDSSAVLFHLLGGNEPKDQENVFDLVHERLRTRRGIITHQNEKKSEEEMVLDV